MTGFFVLLFLLFDVGRTGLARLDWAFLTGVSSRHPQKSGILVAWVGTLWIIVLTGMIAVPIGIAAASFLEEYAGKNRWTHFIELNIANLAGVPSIIYGLFGVAVFVRGMDLTRSILAGAMTMATLILPMIILSTREAIHAVPGSLREASFALGASQWQTLWHQTLPAATPGILTGVILALSRAIGEAAPMMAMGALAYITFLPVPPFSPAPPYLNTAGLFSPFTVLPIQIFGWVSRPQQAFSINAAAAIVVLLGMTFLMNGIAAVLRYRYQKKRMG